MSATLWLPQSVVDEHPHLRGRQKSPRAALRRAAPREAPGRRIGKPHGSYIDGLAAQRQVITLCRGCKSRFDHVRAHYYKDRRLGEVVAKCDACRELDFASALYIHESYLVQNGRTRHGQSWLPR